LEEFHVFPLKMNVVLKHCIWAQDFQEGYALI